MKQLVFALITIAGGTSAVALDCKTAMTTLEVNECASIEQRKVEARLNETYQRVIQSLDQPDTDLEKFSQMKSRLMTAQRAWVKFREADCQAVYTYYQAGTIRAIMFTGCMKSHAENRIKDLQAYGQP
jgi:uncharacterized protein YecT (DUF1311 family)